MDPGDYIIYADESGDPSISSINPEYPVFVLTFCIFRKDDYMEKVVPLFQRIKFHYFEHDQVILRGYDIRKSRGHFVALQNPERRASFMECLSGAIAASPFHIIASTILKKDLIRKYNRPDNPYSIALKLCMERAFYFLNNKGKKCTTHIIMEKRGKKENRKLEAEFRSICNGNNYGGRKLPFELVFADKQSNSSGLQLADLAAYPIGRHVLNPHQPNRAYEVFESKFVRNPVTNASAGRGLKTFP